MSASSLAQLAPCFEQVGLQVYVCLSTYAYIRAARLPRHGAINIRRVPSPTHRYRLSFFLFLFQRRRPNRSTKAYVIEIVSLGFSKKQVVSATIDISLYNYCRPLAKFIAQHSFLFSFLGFNIEGVLELEYCSQYTCSQVHAFIQGEPLV